MILLTNFIISSYVVILIQIESNFSNHIFIKKNSIIKFKELSYTEKVKLLIKLSDFVKIIMKKFSSANETF